MVRRPITRRRSKSRAADPAEPAAAPAVALDGVRQVYDAPTGRFRGESPEPVVALDDVSLSVAPGEVVGLTGPSGSGKSTVLHAIAGLLVPTEGSVYLLGTDIAARSNGERLALRRDHVGIVFQHFHLLPSLSARANVALPLVQLGVPRSARRDRAATLLSRVGLDDRADHRPGQLSGGERQRVAIARALATDPAVIVADEPTGELDSETGRRVLDLLTDVASDRAVLITSHDSATLAVSDRIVTLADGRVADRG
ncbi:ABC transporter ATP-binding protein [Halovivax limisalsi]|uniref:ABC transporter ATP-binding protein n=1 Tax=Halovivax limisalsi TaxID=1453760 RepID=UPI001FFCD3E7|nr:ABC transporter ATP-binding protein [Halovivax limisalsi]